MSFNWTRGRPYVDEVSWNPMPEPSVLRAGLAYVTDLVIRVQERFPDVPAEAWADIHGKDEPPA